jgi:hypothetical protein
MFCLVKFQCGSCYFASAARGPYSEMSQIQVKVVCA